MRDFSTAASSLATNERRGGKVVGCVPRTGVGYGEGSRPVDNCAEVYLGPRGSSSSASNGISNALASFVTVVSAGVLACRSTCAMRYMLTPDWCASSSCVQARICRNRTRLRASTSPMGLSSSLAGDVLSVNSEEGRTPSPRASRASGSRNIVDTCCSSMRRMKFRLTLQCSANARVLQFPAALSFATLTASCWRGASSPCLGAAG
jgi:hypothetical protein